MSPSVKQINGKMAFRGNRNRGNFGGGYNNGPMGGHGGGGGGGGNRMNMSPWESQSGGLGGGGGGGNYGGGTKIRQGGGGGGGGGHMNAQALNLANNLLSNLFRNQAPPSLMDMPRGGNMGGGGGGGGNRNRGPMVNRNGGGGNGNRSNNNRRSQGGFQNRGAAGAKSAPKQGNGGGIRKQNAIDRARKVLAKNSNNKKKDAASTGDKRTESKESPYANIHNDMFYCHLCKKHMWDAISFENHIKGRTHLMMREGIEESYHLKANMIRQEAKIAEQLKAIELDRMKSMGKNKQRILDYCTMCDLHFHGHISTHRKSEGHLQLKKFLHPKCIECNQEFPTRIDYDTHLLSPDHLRIASEKNVKVGETKRQTLPILTEEDELKDLRPPQRKRKRNAQNVKKEEGAADDSQANAEVGEDGQPIKKEKEEEGAEAEAAENADGEGGANETKEGDELNESAIKTEEGAEGGAAGDETEEVPLPVDPEDCIIEYTEGDEIPVEIDARMPKYNWTRPVGTTMINRLECYECSLCGKYFDTEKTVEVHSRTVTHHRNFLKFINEKASFTKFAQKRAAAAAEEKARKKRKLEEAEAAAAGGENGEAANAGGEGGEEGANGGGDGELYDPSEATGEDEDAEMGENGEQEGEGENGEDANGGDEMEAQEEEEPQAEPEPEPEPEPAPVPEVKPEPVKATPVKQPAPAANSEYETPAKKATPAARTPAARNTPRGRGRGRYTRY